MFDIPESLVLAANSSNTIEFAAVDSVTGNPLNSGIATFRIVDSNGADLGGHTWPETLAYVPGSDGIFRVEIDKTGIPDPGTYNEGILVFIDSTGREKECYVPIEVRRCDGISRNG